MYASNELYLDDPFVSFEDTDDLASTLLIDDPFEGLIPDDFDLYDVLGDDDAFA